jgi:hypothetical protein
MSTGLESEVSNLSLEAKSAESKTVDVASAEKAQKAPKPKKEAPILLKCAKVYY